MAELALERLDINNVGRRAEINKLKGEAERAKKRATTTAVTRALRKAGTSNRTLMPPQYYFGILPVELVDEVFQYVVDADPPSLLKLLRINKQWRYTAWNTPALWHTIILTHRKPVKKSRLWIKQSRGRIRDLRIGAGVTSDLDWNFSAFEGIQWGWLRHCVVENWDLAHYLEQHFHREGIRQASLSPKQEVVEDRLKSLTPGSEDEQPPKQVDEKTTILRELTTVNIAGCSINSFLVENAKWEHLTLRLTPLPCARASECLHNLTSLNLNTWASGDILAVFRSNPNLQSIILNFPLPAISLTSASSEPIILDQLTHLELVNYIGTPDFLSNLICSKLRVLKMQDLSMQIDEALVHLARRVAPKDLEDLILQRVSMSPVSLVELLKITPKLRELEVKQTIGVSNMLVEALATSSLGGEGMMCPNLKSINLASSSDLKTGPIVRLVKQRNSTPLEELGNATDLNVTIPNASTSNMMPALPIIPRQGGQTGLEKIDTLILNECPLINAEWLTFLRGRVPHFECTYIKKRKEKRWRR